MKIKQIQIKYFRSIYSETINLSDLNIIVGLNDSGKSNLLKALNLFFNGETGWKEEFNFDTDFNLKRLDECNNKGRNLKTAKEIVIKIIFEKTNNTIPVWEKRWRKDREPQDKKYDSKLLKSKRKETGFQKMSRIPVKMSKIEYFYVPALKSPDYISHLIGRLSDILSEKAADDIRKAAAGFEKELGNHLSSITKDIQEALKIDSSLKLPANLIGIFENMEFSDARGVGLSHRGDGIRTRHIPILLDKISSLHSTLRRKGEHTDYFIWGYEEPENNVELQASLDMADDFLKQYSKTYQIILTTHSPAFYGLPERCNKKWSQSENGMHRYFATQSNGKTYYKEKFNEELDKLFLLPLVAEYIEENKKRHAELEYRIKDLQNDKPNIFLEGNTDKEIFKKVYELFFSDNLNNFKFTSGESGGVDYIRDSLLAWHQSEKHKKQSKTSVGLFDDDDAGNRAIKKFNQAMKPSKSKTYSFAMKYNGYLIKDSHFYQLENNQLKIKVPVTLETLYPPMIWKIAKEKNWLEIKPELFNNICNEAAIEIASTQKSINDYSVDASLLLYVTHRFTDKGKVEVVKFIKRSSASDAKKYLYLLEPILKDVLNKMFNSDSLL